MGRRLNRRRYAEVVKLLKEVIGNERAGIARRMKAAETLLSVYDRHDRATERAEAKRSAALKADTETGHNVQDGETREAKEAREAREAEEAKSAAQVEEAFLFLRGGAARNADRP